MYILDQTRMREHILRILIAISISFRQLHVMDETHVMNQVKEDVCYVSQDFYKDMEIAQ